MNFEKTSAVYRERVEMAIREWLPQQDSQPPALHEAMRYALEAGGKRLRPVMVLAAADLLPARVEPDAAAAAIEYLHTYTLVHDDLPCMDDSALRRGRLSVHAQFGETVAVLAGDALLTEAFSVLARAYTAEPAVGLKLVEILSIAAGSSKLIEGQTADTLWEGQVIRADELERIHLHKTAALFSAALQMGLATTKASASALDAGAEIGRELGLAFQIVDDVLDATGSEESLGKQAGGDAEKNKNTYVSLHGIEASRERVRALTYSARERCRQLSDRSGFLQDLITQLEYRLS